MQWDALLLEGADSPDLTRQLVDENYDFVVFAGCSASTHVGMMALPPRLPVAFIPLATQRPLEWFEQLDEVFDRADAVIAFSKGEAQALHTRGPSSSAKVTNIGFVFRVHELARESDPHGHEFGHRVAVVTDWRDRGVFNAIRPWLVAASTEFSGVEFRPLGPGAEQLPFPYTTPLSEGRLDTWRWMARCIAAVDPRHHRLLGRDTVEALQYGVPVLVPEAGGASREHAEVGNGGLWYRSYQDFAACLERIRSDNAIRHDLSAQGRAYANEFYGDTKRFIGAVVDTVGRIAD